MLDKSQVAEAINNGIPIESMTNQQKSQFIPLLLEARPQLSEKELSNCKFRVNTLTVKLYCR